MRKKKCDRYPCNLTGQSVKNNQAFVFTATPLLKNNSPDGRKLLAAFELSTSNTAVWIQAVSVLVEEGVIGLRVCAALSTASETSLKT